MFPPSPAELVVLGVVGIVVIGPDRLPKVAADLGRVLRQLRGLADDARATLHEELGADVADLRRLDPRHLIREQLYGDPQPPLPGARPAPESLPGATPPYDPDAT